MLINFCRKCMESSATCSTVSNDGYEVTNLTCDSDRGFLAYSCIKPPIHIDFSFICNIHINHLLIWPSVGAQKSSAFEISVQTADRYKQVATGFLSPEHLGLFFYRRDTDPASSDVPPQFLRRYLKLSHDENLKNVRNLRISILRTENSVPAVGRVEIWGRVSSFNSRKTIERVLSLWHNHNVQTSTIAVKNTDDSSGIVSVTERESVETRRSVPDCFLDPITCDIMIRPIVLPSGAIIDQETLEKHGKSEATWGRALSDPFTGIPLTEVRRPIIASALKARIDKYLLENKLDPEVKSLPRSLGHKQVVMSLRNRALDLSEISETAVAQCLPMEKVLEGSRSRNVLQKSATEVSSPKTGLETRVHRLPIVPMCSKRTIGKKRSENMKIKSFGISAFKKEIKVTPKEKSELEDSSLNVSVTTVLSNLQRFSEDKRVKENRCIQNCKCMSNVFYKLPCNHILCRDVLMSVGDSRCVKCRGEYESKDLERIHGELTLK